MKQQDLYALSVSGIGYVNDGVYLTYADNPTEAIIRLYWVADNGETEDEYQEKIMEFAVKQGYDSIHDMCNRITPDDIVHLHQLFSHDPFVAIANLSKDDELDKMIGLEFNGWLEVNDSEDFMAWFNA